MIREECYVDQDSPWDPEHWYTFDITMDGATITLTIDGELRNSWNYGGVSEDLLAGFGWPPSGSGYQDTNGGIVGMEFRNISFTKS